LIPDADRRSTLSILPGEPGRPHCGQEIRDQGVKSKGKEEEVPGTGMTWEGGGCEDFDLGRAVCRKIDGGKRGF